MNSSLPRPPALRNLRLLNRLLQDPQPVLDEIKAVYGGVCGLGWGPMGLAVVGDPGAIRELLAKPTSDFRWGHKFNVLGFVVGSTSMIVSDGDDHKRRRAPIQGAFARRHLNGWIPMIVQQADAAVDELVRRSELSTDRTVDVTPICRSVVIRIVVRALFGEHLSDRADEIGQLFIRPQQYLESSAVAQFPHPFPFTKRARVRADRRALDTLIDEEIDRRSRLDSNGSFDVLDALIADGGLDHQEIRDQVVTLIGAGYDTTAAALAWMCLCAASQPGLWERLRVEADEVLGPIEGQTNDLNESTLASLSLAHRVARETLRLYPPGAFAPREAAVDVSLGSVVIPKGTLIVWSPYLAGRDPATWSDPLSFDPDRFVDLDPTQAALSEAAWVPFGKGARMCVGFALAQMEMTLIIARFAQRLDVSRATASMPKPVGMVVNRPEGGAPITVEARRINNAN